MKTLNHNMTNSTTSTSTGVHLQGIWKDVEKVTQCVQTIHGVRTYQIIAINDYPQINSK